MAVFGTKFTFFSIRNGWTETWYQQGAASLTAALANALDLATSRVKLLGNPSIVETYSVWDVSTPWFRLLRPLNKGNDFAGFPVLATDTAWNAVRVRCLSTMGLKRNFWLRGFPDDAIRFDPTSGVPRLDLPLLVNLWQAFTADLRAKIAVSKVQWSMRSYDRTLPWVPIPSITKADPDLKAVINVNAHGYVTGQVVVIRRCQGQNTRVLNRRATVQRVDDNSFTLRQVTFPAGSHLVYTPNSGQVRAVNEIYDAVDILGSVPTDFRKKSTGRALMVSRGRAVKRKPLFT